MKSTITRGQMNSLSMAGTILTNCLACANALMPKSCSEVSTVIMSTYRWKNGAYGSKWLPKGHAGNKYQGWGSHPDPRLASVHTPVTPTGNIQQKGQECIVPLPPGYWGQKLTAYRVKIPLSLHSPGSQQPLSLILLCFAAWDAFVMFNLYPLIIKWLHH